MIEFIRYLKGYVLIKVWGFADLYAEKEGTIVSMVVRSGVPMVKIGDRVEVGIPLVSGEVPVYNDDETIRKYRETYADADIVIRRKENIYETLSFVREKKVYTGREKKKYVFRFFGKEILLGKQVKMDSEEGKWILTGELTVEEKIGVQIER